MKILFIGDIVGPVGIKAIKGSLNKVIKDNNIDFVIANGENISKGKGITLKDYNFLLNEGVDVVTLGNHYHSKSNVDEFINDDYIIRPLNLKDYDKGEGSKEYIVNNKKIRITSLLGNVFMPYSSNPPYEELNKVLANDDSDIHIIDFHGEASSEKKAFAYLFKDKISALIGTHTHTQTNDEKIIDDKLFYVSDVGMCGSFNSVIGGSIDSSINRVIFNKENKIEYLEDDTYIFNAVVMEFDDLTLKPLKIYKINIVK